MSPRDTTSQPELFELLEAMCEDRLSPADAQRLERLVLKDAAARRTYLAYLDLHGTLHWNAAYGSDGGRFEPAVTPRAEAASPVSRKSVIRPQLMWLMAASVLMTAGLSFALGRWGRTGVDGTPPVIATNGSDANSKDNQHDLSGQNVPDPKSGSTEIATNNSANKPVRIGSTLTDSPKAPDLPNETTPNTPIIANDNRAQRPTSESNKSPRTSGSVAAVVSVINEHLSAGWKLNGIEPSAPADDAEWMRRIYLDVVGHIPPVDVAEHFLADRNPRKREKLVDTLLDDSGYIRNWTIVWSNLLIGRSDDRNVNRAALQKYLRESFAQNRPWSEMVADFISAEGRFDENGATNFLLAHLNNQAVPAAAITAKIFLGRQIGCTQCHDHPFNDWKQDTFWSFKSFFEQTAVARVDRRDDHTGQMKSQAAVLERKPVGGEVTFENRAGFMKAARPKFEGTDVGVEADVDRRHELAKLMIAGEKPMIAEALVNRMWEHFFGCGFTRDVADLGPHNPPSHPELLDHLAREFVASSFDLKQLIRWVCLSDAYQRTSRFGSTNAADDPVTGTTPLFSRVYVKGMTAEQLYDSLLLATGAAKTPLESGDHDRRRHEWLQQFVRALETEENDESVTFESSITQALLLMNSELTERAVSLDRGTFLEKLIHDRDSEADKLKRLCLATLSRYPSQKELQVLRKLIHDGTASRPNAGWQDALWAYLNSSEFILVH